MFDTTQPQVDATANQPDNAEVIEEAHETADVPDESFLTVRYNKEDMPLSKDEATTYAQKGMNYDKLSRRLEKANAKLSEYDEILVQGDGQSSGQGYEPSNSAQTVIDGQLGDFIKNNPGVDPRQLPGGVLESWSRGVPLSEAYLSYQAGELWAQTKSLEREIAQRDINAKNAGASMGKPQSKGETREKQITHEAIKNMSVAELDRNHERIWKFLTGNKKD